MTPKHRPIYLLADSQLLFTRGDAGFLTKLVKDHLPSRDVKAAYIGASNGDQPGYYDIFKAAMGNVGLENTRMIRSEFSKEDRDFLQDASLILLAGGDVALGWETLSTTGISELLVARYEAGAVLMGVSAGAVQLGLKGRREKESDVLHYFETLKLVPLFIDCHDEAADWEGLQIMLKHAKIPAPAIGIPFGAGLVYYDDHTLQPIGKPLVEFEFPDPKKPISRNILYPNPSNG